MTLVEKTTSELRTQLANCQRVLARDAQNAKAQAIAKEISAVLASRRGSRRTDWQALDWNPDTIKRALEPFVALTRTVPQNGRTVFTEAGGAKLRGDSWIETYTSVKANGVNRLFIALVAKQGDDPVFLIPAERGKSHGTIAQMIEGAEFRFGPDHLDEALRIWAEIIRAAGGASE